ncbi:MAG: HAMP domain-containing sensor histidine kinase [Anaerobutyricum sp.]|nr:HAMP domain-containing sensor histidine kinase [Anaerobutyricum sp.]
MKKMFRYVSLYQLIGVIVFLLINISLTAGISHQIKYYEKKALEQRINHAQKQSTILADQICINGLRKYSMITLSDEGGAKVFEVEQLANNLGGRILLINSRFKIIADTYNRNCGQYLVTSETIHAMRGEKPPSKQVGEDYLRLITPIEDKTKEKEEIKGLIIVMSSLKGCNEMRTYLHDQRDNIVGIFFVLTLIFSVLLSLLIRNSFRNLQNELDIIAAGHQEEGLAREGFREFDRMAASFNKIINRYQELESTRQEFVSNVSHELKTPITSMKILADSLLTQKDVPVEIYEDFMNDIVHEIDRENQIITDLLTLVKMDKTEASLNITQVNINELLEVLLKRISPIAEKRGITIRLETMRQVVAEVDEVKLSLACNNLIENAVKYNKDDGRVDVSLNADHKFFYIRVKDTGCGIPEDCQEQIFERFYRVDKARSRETGGTGLGLAITRNVVLLHKGSIRVHSKEGEGATFIIRIPLNYIG